MLPVCLSGPALWSVVWVVSVIHLDLAYGQQSEPTETIAGLYSIEQPGTGDCITFDPADNPMDEDKITVTRCRDSLPDGTQKFQIDANLDDGRFSIAPEGNGARKCFYGDTGSDLNILDRSTRHCNKNLNYFVTMRTNAVDRMGSDLLIKNSPTDLCVSSHMDGLVHLATCDAGNARQKWKICRVDDSDLCFMLERTA